MIFKECMHCGKIYDQNRNQCPRCLSSISNIITHAIDQQVTIDEKTDYEQERAYSGKKQFYADMEGV